MHQSGVGGSFAKSVRCSPHPARPLGFAEASDSRKLDSRLVAVAMQRASLCAERARETHSHESLIYAMINAIGTSDPCQEQAQRRRTLHPNLTLPHPSPKYALPRRAGSGQLSDCARDARPRAPPRCGLASEKQDHHSTM